MSNIKKVIASIEELHGDDRARRASHDSYIAFLIRKRMENSGAEAPSSLKHHNEDPCDEVAV